MTKIENFRELKVWQSGKELATEIYRITKKFPPNEQFGLASQMQRSAVSIPSNIAEGFCREGDKEFRRFLLIARGSAAELETQLAIANDLGYIDDKTCDKLTESLVQLHKMINGLLRHIRNSSWLPATTWPTDCPTTRLPDQLTNWLIDQPTNWLTDHLTTRPTDYPTNRLTNFMLQ